MLGTLGLYFLALRAAIKAARYPFCPSWTTKYHHLMKWGTHRVDVENPFLLVPGRRRNIMNCLYVVFFIALMTSLALAGVSRKG
jgi:hypothetical protein